MAWTDDLLELFDHPDTPDPDAREVQDLRRLVTLGQGALDRGDVAAAEELRAQAMALVGAAAHRRRAMSPAGDDAVALKVELGGIWAERYRECATFGAFATAAEAATDVEAVALLNQLAQSLHREDALDNTRS